MKFETQAILGVLAAYGPSGAQAATACIGYLTGPELVDGAISIQEANSLINDGESDTVTLQGIVTNDLTETGFAGLYLQAPVSQLDQNFTGESEAIFLWCGNSGSDCDSVSFEEGDLITVTGTMSVFSTNNQLSPATILSNDEDLKFKPSDACPELAYEVNIPDLVLPRAEDFDDYSINGMLVSPVIDTSEPLAQDVLTLTNTFDFRYGQISFSAIGRRVQPSSIFNTVTEQTELEERESLNARATLNLDDRESSQCPLNTPWFDVSLPGGGLRTGATLDVSVLDAAGTYSFQNGLNEFVFRPSQFGIDQVNVQAFEQEPRVESLEGLVAESSATGGVRVASFNMLNYFVNFIDEDDCGDCRGADTAAEFELQSIKLYEGLLALDAAVVGLQEIQNELADFPLAVGDSEDIVLDTLVNSLNELAGEEKYAYINTGAVGADAIRVGFLYQPAFVTPVGDFQTLFYTNPVDKSRDALAQTFSVVGTSDCLVEGEPALFTVVNNHFKSKGSACDEDEDGNDDFAFRVAAEGNCGYTRLKHTDQLAEWLEGDDFDSNAGIILVGDLNSYGSERPIVNLEQKGFVEISGSSVSSPKYSYSFDGLFGSLDHIMVSEGFAEGCSETFKWHINSDEPIVTDYTTEQYGATACLATPAGYQDESLFRNSDHDPAVSVCNMCLPVVAVEEGANDDDDDDDDDIEIVVGFSVGLAVLAAVVLAAGSLPKKEEEIVVTPPKDEPPVKASV